MAENTNVRELGEQYETQKALLEKTQKELAEERATNRVLKAQGFGLNEAQAKVFAQANPGVEVTADAVKSFSESLGIGTAPPAPKQEPAPATTPSTSQQSTTGEPAKPETNPGMALIGGASGRAGDGGQLPAGTERLTTAALTELAKTDPVAADRALREGRVEFSKDNFYVRSGLMRQPS
jgi:ribosomal protein L12E/L44/L45/RPP1/RPP2